MSTPCYQNVVYGPTAEVTAPDPTTNVIIPTTGKPKLKIQTVYGDDGVQVAYYEYSLVIDTVIYDAVTVLSDIEAEAKRIATILKTPGYSLVFAPVGVGTYGAVVGPGSTNVTFPAGTKMDIKGGPYPQSVTVEPIASNNAIYIAWEVMFRTTECPNLLPNLVQYNSELDFDVDDDGDLTFNLRVTYQTAVPVTDISTLNPLVNTLVATTGTSFQGMRRRKRTSQSRDQRTTLIHVEFRPIKSDNAFFRNTHNIEATDSIAADLLGSGPFGRAGFNAWTRRLTATITLPARVHKSYAWLVYLKIVADRFRNLHQIGKLANLPGNTPAAGQPNAEKDKNFYILTKVSITEQIYSRSITFETDYLVVTDLATIIKQTKIGERVNTLYDEPLPADPTTWVPKPLSDQWKDWQFNNARRAEELNGLFEYKVAGTPIVYNQCTGVGTFAKLGASALMALETESAEDYKTLERYKNEKYSWLDYKNKFSFEEETRTVQISYLQPVASDTYVTTEADASDAANRSRTGMTLHGRKYPIVPSKPNKMIARGPSTYKVRMQGSSYRVGSPIDFPAVCKVGNELAIRTDNPQMSQTQIAVGDVPVYFAEWDITYILNKDPYADDTYKAIVTSGDPAQYS